MGWGIDFGLHFKDFRTFDFRNLEALSQEILTSFDYAGSENVLSSRVLDATLTGWETLTGVRNI